MSRPVIFGLSLALVGALGTGCAVDECDKHGDRPQCQSSSDMGTGGLLTLSSRRLNIKGDTVVVSMSAKTSASDSVKIAQLGAMDLDLGKLGTGTVVVSGTMLKANQFTPGPATLIIGANAPEPVRFYLAPSYVKTTTDVSTGTEIPFWAGIGSNKTLVSLNDTMTAQPSVHFVEYSSASGLATFTGAKSYTPTSRGGITLGQKYIGFPNAFQMNNILLRACPLGSDNCNEIQTTNLAIADLALDRKGTLLGAILDNQLVAYFVNTSFGTVTAKMSLSAVTSPKLVGSDDIDGDGLADFVAWDGKSLSVLRQSKAGGVASFTVDSSLSSQLNAARGTDQPTALFINDVDGDGLSDVVYTTTNQFVWLLNTPDSNVKFVKGGAMSVVSGSVDSLAVGDVDIDNKNDIVIASKSDKNIKVFINQSTY